MESIRVKKSQSVLLNLGLASVALVSLETSALACDPNAITLTAIAPGIVNVPVGGTARVVGLVHCSTDANDFAADGNQANYQIRLMDEDPANDDKLGMNRDTFQRVPGQGAAFRRRVKLNYTLRCPAANPRIEGTENSGEGQPGAGDPADLVLEIDNGATTKGANHYPGNVVGNPAAGKTIPAECVLGLGEEDQISSASMVQENQALLARSAFLATAETLQTPTDIPAEVALGDYSETQAKALMAGIGKGLLGSGEQLAMLNVPTHGLGVDLSDTTLGVAQELLVAYGDLADGDAEDSVMALANVAAVWRDAANNSGRLTLSERTEIAYSMRQLSVVFQGLAEKLQDIISAAESFDSGLANRVVQFDIQRSEAAFFLSQLSAAIQNSAVEPSVVNLTVGAAPESFLSAPGSSIQLFAKAGQRYACEVSDQAIGSSVMSFVAEENLPSMRILESTNGRLQFNYSPITSGVMLLPVSRDAQDRFFLTTAQCCTALVRGKYNTVSTPYNFVELVNKSESAGIDVKLSISLASEGVPTKVEATVFVPPGGRVDVGVHDLLAQKQLPLRSFGVIEATYNGPINSLAATVSYYGEGLVLRQSQELKSVDCVE